MWRISVFSLLLLCTATSHLVLSFVLPNAPLRSASRSLSDRGSVLPWVDNRHSPLVASTTVPAFGDTCLLMSKDDSAQESSMSDPLADKEATGDLAEIEAVASFDAKQVLNALYGGSKAQGLRCLNVADMNNSRAFFVEGAKPANVRHNGVNDPSLLPEFVSLRLDESKSNVVFNSFSSRGSGKTIDLIGMAYIRNKDLTLYLNPDMDMPMSDAEEEQLKELRKENYGKYIEIHNEKAQAFMKELVGEVIDRNKELFSELKRQIGNNKLKLAVSVDEAYFSLLFARSIIQDTKGMREAVKSAFADKDGPNIDENATVFSIGGLGASAVAMGSDPSLWEEWKTSASENPRGMYGSLMF